MKRNVSLAILIGALVFVLGACSSEPAAIATATITFSLEPEPTAAPIDEGIVPDVEIDDKTAMLLGIDLHRQLWATRPSNNYKFGFQWTDGEYAYQKANVEVRILKGDVNAVLWADNAVLTDGTEPAGFEVPENPVYFDYYSIDGLFAVIAEAIDSDPARVTLGFDSVFGFPTNVIIEFAPENGHKNIAFMAAQLVPIPGPPE